MPRRWVVLLILICIVLNGAGFAWKLFEPIPLYDEIAHFLTPFVLVAILAEIIYRGGGDDEFFNTPRRAVITGSVIGLVGAVLGALAGIILDESDIVWKANAGSLIAACVAGARVLGSNRNHRRGREFRRPHAGCSGWLLRCHVAHERARHVAPTQRRSP